MTLVHVVDPVVFTYNRVLVDDPSDRRYSEPLAAEIVGKPDPKNMPKFAVAETNNPAPAVPPAVIVVPLAAVTEPIVVIATADAEATAFKA